MIKFSELYSKLSESELTEFRVVSKAARRKTAIRMKRLVKSSAFKKKVERSKLRIASPEKQKVKAAKKAKQIVINKYFPTYDNMGIAQRVQVDQRIQAMYGNLIAKLTLKQMKFVKKDEIQKVKNARKAKQDD
jgi:hypothetical protein|tara:strand:+ start:40 stop:438 length:399 start_codon:yes stop_codon:yes gene_type:complete